MTQSLTVDGGSIAYDLEGAGPLVVLAHGMGDSREAYRFLVPGLVAAGYRVANVDIRGAGESSAAWPSYTRTAIAGDLLAVVRHLGGPAVLVGHSISGGAVTIAAAQAPQLVTGLVELAPFTREQNIRLGDFASREYRRGSTRLMTALTLGSPARWQRYLDAAYPGVKPADWAARSAQLTRMLGQRDRMKALQAMGKATPADAGAQLGHVACPVLVVEGSADADWVSARAEGEAILAELPAGLGRLAMIEGAGHYPHVQYPEQTLQVVLPFLATVTGADGSTGA